MKKTWIVVADSAHARIFTVKTPTSPLEEIKDEVDISATFREKELVTDEPGRHTNDSRTGVHAYEPEHTKHETEIIRFAKALAEELNKAFHLRKFEQLVLVAPPKFLGHLRESLHEPVLRAVSLQCEEDLVKETPEQIRQHLPEYLPQL